MILDIVGALLPTAAGIALSPFPIVAAILVVGGPHARSAGPTFAFGWLVGLSALTALAIAVGSLIGSGESPTWASWARILLGTAVVALGVRKFMGRPREDEASTMPGWMAGLADAPPGRALLIGLGLAALNPKNIAFALASASIIGQVDQDTSSALVEAAVFVLLASATVIGVVLVSQLGGQRGARTLASLQERLLEHNDAIVAAVFVLIGATVLGDGLAGLN